MKNDNQKILITGVTGLVGTRLLPRLIEAKFECHALVRGGKEIPKGAIAIDGDVLDQGSLAKAVKNASAIVHLAAVFRSQDTDLIWNVNLNGTKNLIEAVKTHAPDARFILASTSNVYNKDNPHPGQEDDAVEPVPAYPASKVQAEKVLRESGLNWSILRFSFVYGDGDGHLEMLPHHVNTAKFHPAMRMSTIHHQDIFTAINMALQGVMDGRVVNITDEAPTTIFELLKIAGTTIESNSQPLTDPWYLHTDGSLARSLGFRPKIRTVYQAVQENIL